MNVKLLPTHYVLKRWTREARHGTIQDTQGRSIIENPNLDAIRCYKILSYKFFNLAHQVINSLENFMLVANTLDSLRRQVEEQDASLDTTNNLC
jgi:zinc finger SWIM domain-containing protein 3